MVQCDRFVDLSDGFGLVSTFEIKDRRAIFRLQKRLNMSCSQRPIQIIERLISEKAIHYVLRVSVGTVTYTR